MTTLKIDIGNQVITIKAEPLTPEAFAPFGDVISNPRPDLHPHEAKANNTFLTKNAVSANQGTAIQYRNVSHIRNLYDQAPSGKSEPKMSMFVCAARELQDSRSGGFSEFNVRFLERHPFTTQTFTPIASSASSYLVIVAPTLPPSSRDEGLPVPSRGVSLPGRGLPDLNGLKAFIATAKQAVTYGAGTWHAPMVTLGKVGTALDFVVYQFGSGEGLEDCQLVEFESEGAAKPVIFVQLLKKQLWAKL